jgi:hypothetical protein
MATEYSAIATGGSKDGDMIALTAVLGQHVYSLRLPSVSSIISAEANVIHLALKFVVSSFESKFMILFLAC